MRAWLAVWAALLLACVALGAATRLTYTDFTSNPAALMGLPYWYVPFSTEKADAFTQGFGASYTDPDALYDQADAVIACTFTGKRSYSYEAFLSQVEVSRVFKGDAGLAGTTMAVYEPMKIAARHDGTNGRQLEAQDAYLLGGTLMREGGDYLLFVKERDRSPAQDAQGEKPEYVLCKSPYAKLGLEDGRGEGYQAPKQSVSVAESLDYDVLAADSASAQAYYQTRASILQKLGA